MEDTNSIDLPTVLTLSRCVYCGCYETSITDCARCHVGAELLRKGGWKWERDG